MQINQVDFQILGTVNSVTPVNQPQSCSILIPDPCKGSACLIVNGTRTCYPN